MDQKPLAIATLEEKIIDLLNRLKENHLNLTKLTESNESLSVQNKALEEKILALKEENKSLKIANNLLGSNEGKTQTKTKINSLIKEVDYCIQQLSEIN
jgi:predicted RNase H-like nuclease (RuvC/YqgF family)